MHYFEDFRVGDTTICRVKSRDERYISLDFLKLVAILQVWALLAAMRCDA
jgi:hypothetical protein